MKKQLNKLYSTLFTGKIFVMKAGGRVITDDAARKNLLKNIQQLNEDGIKVLLIYGGGEAIDQAIHAEGREPLKIDGRRITSEADIKTVKKVLCGDLGHRLSETMAEIGLDGYCLNALPPNWIKVKRRPKKNGIARFDATIEEANSKDVKHFFSGAKFVACPCLGLRKDGTTLNINADNAAVALAKGCKTAKLIFLSDIDGIMIDGKVASVLRAKDLQGLIDTGIITGGMQVKAENCIDAVQNGVKRVHIINGFRKNALLDEVYTNTGTGTMIVRLHEKKRYESMELFSKNTFGSFL